MNEPSAIGRTYNHRSALDLADLRLDLDSLSLEQKSIAFFMAYRAGLIGLTWSIRLVLGVVCLRYGAGRGTALYAVGVAAHAPKMAQVFWDGLMTHMTSGRDTDDPTSAGGWNRRKLNLFLSFVSDLGWSPPAW